MPVLLQNQWDIIPTSNKVNAKSQLFRAAWYNFIFPKTKTKKSNSFYLLHIHIFLITSNSQHFQKCKTMTRATVFKVNPKGWWTEARPQAQM